VTGSHDKVIRVFDLDKKDEIVQRNLGHTDEIRSIIHIPARNQVFINIFYFSMFQLLGITLSEYGMVFLFLD
jgi:WD40 repeat protein